MTVRELDRLDGLEKHLQRVEEKIDCLLKKYGLQSEAATGETEGDDVSAYFGTETQVSSNPSVEKKEVDPQELKKTVCEYLRNLGMPPHIKGYLYSIEAITMAVNDYSIMSSVTKEMYPTIAKTYDTTPSRVERAIRHATEVTWCKGNFEFQQEILGYVIDPKKGKPTNSEFIAGVADRIRLMLKKS